MLWKCIARKEAWDSLTHKELAHLPLLLLSILLEVFVIATTCFKKFVETTRSFEDAEFINQPLTQFLFLVAVFCAILALPLHLVIAYGNFSQYSEKGPSVSKWFGAFVAVLFALVSGEIGYVIVVLSCYDISLISRLDYFFLGNVFPPTSAGSAIEMVKLRLNMLGLELKSVFIIGAIGFSLGVTIWQLFVSDAGTMGVRIGRLVSDLLNIAVWAAILSLLLPSDAEARSFFAYFLRDLPHSELFFCLAFFGILHLVFVVTRFSNGLKINLNTIW